MFYVTKILSNSISPLRIINYLHSINISIFFIIIARYIIKKDIYLAFACISFFSSMKFCITKKAKNPLNIKLETMRENINLKILLYLDRPTFYHFTSVGYGAN